MLKQQIIKIKKVLTILLLVLFVVSLTAAALSAEPVVIKEKKMVVNSENDKKLDMKNMDMKKVTFADSILKFQNKIYFTLFYKLLC